MKRSDLLYDANDMVKAGCNDCRGCSACCTGMGESVILDPYDIWQMEINLHCTFAELMRDKIDLHVEEGIIFWMRMEDAAFIRFDPVSAGCFRSEEVMRRVTYNIFCCRMPVRMRDIRK